MSIKPMSPQQERFASEVAKHGNQSEAFRVAFPASRNWKPESVNAKASHLMAVGKVRARVNALRKITEKRLGMSRIQWLEEIAKLARDRKNPRQLDALVQFGKAQGYYEPERLVVDNKVQVTVLHMTIDERLARLQKVIEAEARDKKP
jgi:hypothetical protein